eukprot:TRINITY_DN74361_c0_g1_i1.p1 TRINITY_DN74361_c0_g1~~TRINITY_DN74361_c0_g1_i1.p1  ORF type:complete len:249 (+),score=39.84 TRINITY_DN74361_c0_g1_i1:76-822(+)
MSTATSNLPRLRYFMFPGRCYAARVALFNTLGKDGWVDERLGQGAFKKLKQQASEQRASFQGKPSTVLLTNNLPQLVLPNGITVGQSHAIARWAARQPRKPENGNSECYELYPCSNSDESLRNALLIDEAMALVDSVVGFAPKDEDKAVRQQKRKDYAYSLDGSLRIGMGVLEHRLAESSSEGPFLLGKELSIGDLYMKKPLADMITDGQFEGVDTDYLDKFFPRIRDHSQAVAQHPLVVEYLKHYKN